MDQRGRWWLLGALLVILAVAGPLALVTLPAGATAEEPSPTLHPAYRLLDEDGRNVRDSGGPVSPLRTCGSCHDARFIASHSPHSDVGLGALLAFWGAEKLERRFGHPEDLTTSGRPMRRLGAAAALVVLALATLGLGQPSAADRWKAIAEETQPLLDSRAVQIHPAELVDLNANKLIRLVILDVRDEADFNVFHLADARRVDIGEIVDGLVGLELLSAPSNTVTVVVSNDERRATEAWRLLVAQSLLNVYILEGGMNHWLETFGHVGHERCLDVAPSGNSTLRHRFESALGSAHPSADLDALRDHGLECEKKVTLQTRKTLGGGCG